MGSIYETCNKSLGAFAIKCSTSYQQLAV